MAMIEKIRNQRWLLIAVVGISLLGFLINGAVLQWLTGGPGDLGEIDGDAVDVTEWQAAVEQQRVLFQYEGNETSLSNDTWNNLIETKLYSKAFEDAGVTVTEEEYDEILFGEMLSPYVRQTIYGGQDSASFREMMRTNFDGMEPQRAMGWKKLIMHKRMKEKYDLMLKKGLYANHIDGKWAFKQQSDKISVSYVVKTFAEIPDSAVTVSEQDIRAYYNKHKNDRENKQEVSRSVNYIRFPVRPSSTDSLSLSESLVEIAESFRTSTDDSAFAAANTAMGARPFIKYSAGKFPEPYNTQVLNDSIGKVIGPFVQDGRYVLAKVNKRISELDSVKARHILVKADRKNPEELAKARIKADSIKSVIAKDKNFEDMAARFGTDGTKNSGGDLGWFAKGAMVKEFEDASFKGKVGELQLVTTDFGVHVLEVTDQKYAVARVALVEKNIEPSSQTRKSAYSLAREFSLNFADTASFRSAADTLNGGTPIVQAKNIRPNSTSINGLQNAYEVVSWAYGAELGEVSQPMLIDSDYIIAALADVKERGVPTLANVYEKMKTEAIREKKAEMYVAKMKSGSLEEIAAAAETKVKTADNLTLKSGNIPGSGVSAQEYEVIGVAFGLKKDFISSPVKGKGGVYVLQRTSDLIEGTSSDNYTADRDQMITNLQNRAVSSVFNSMKEEADIIDDRFTRR